MAKPGKWLTKKRCRVCGHEWFPRSPRRPGVCPKCKSANWDRKEERKEAL